MRRPTVDRVATVTTVNTDGTVNVDWGGGSIGESLPCLSSYSPRAVGDRVLVRSRQGQFIVQGRDGQPAVVELPQVMGWTFGTAAQAAPWLELTKVWVLPDATAPTGYKAYGQLLTAAPPPAAATSQRVVAAEFGRYRDGGIVGRDYAEQGSFAGFGPHTGVITYPAGAWGFLAGKTVTGVRAVLHRRSSPHGVIAAAETRLWLHSFTSLPNAAGPADLRLASDTLQPRVALQRNETSSEVPLPTSWGVELKNGTAQGIGIYDGSVNTEIDRLDVIVSFA